MDLKKTIISIFILFLIIIFSLFVFCYFYFAKDNEKAGVYYSQGLQFYEKNDFQNAYFNFSKVSPFSSLFPNALYKMAKSADNLNDKKSAIKNYSILDKIIKNEIISPYILWRLAQLHQENAEHMSSKHIYSRLRKEYPESEYGIAASYMLAKYSRNPKKRMSYLLEYIKKSPKGKYAKEVLLSILQDDVVKLTDEEKLAFAKSLVENDAHNRAISVLKEVPIEFSWVYLVQALDKLNSSSNIIKVAIKGMESDNSHFDEDALNDALSIYVKYLPKEPYSSWLEIYNKTEDSKIKAVSLYKMAQYSNSVDSIKRKIQLYENYPDSKFANEALYSLFMANLTNNKIAKALKYAEEYSEKYNDKDRTPVALYFTALLKKKQQDIDYKEAANRLISEYPNTYYAYRAYSTLINKNFANLRRLEVPIEPPLIEFPYKQDKKLTEFFENFVEEKDFTPFADFRINDPIIRSWVEYYKGNRALSSVLSRDYIRTQGHLPQRPDLAWKLAYPIYYGEEINKYSKENNLNPYLILALMKEESHFDANIRSSVGATGLMQIMPATAAMISGKYYSPEELKDPDLNIKLGAKYFAELMEIFMNNEPMCVLSYNSGPNAAKKWVKDGLLFDIMIESIPYPETKNYIKKVYTTYWNYLLTYGGIKI